jgi:flagellar hook-associated protein 3 FlgL
MISNLSPANEAFVANTERVQRSLAEASQQVSSGLRVNVASDAPGDVGNIMQLRTDMVRNTQIQSNLALAKTDADAADSAFNSATKLMDRARTLGAQGANFTLDAAGRQSLADEVGGLLEQMVSISQTGVQGRYIFGGDDAATPPYQLDPASATGVTQLNTASATRLLEDPAGGSFAVGKTASEIFDARNADGTPADTNVFAALNGLRVALLANDTTAINAAVGAVQTASDHLNLSQGFYGNVLNRIQDAVNYGQSYDVQLKTQLGQKVDADVTAAAMTMSQGNLQLQAAFQMQAKMPHTSLFDFLG